MTDPDQSRSRGVRLRCTTSAIVVLLSACVVVAASLYHHVYSVRAREDVEHRLTSVGSAKAAWLRQWMRAMLGGYEFLRNSPEASAAFRPSPGAMRSSEGQARIRARLRALQHTESSGVALLDGSGRTIACEPPSEAPCSNTARSARECAASGRVRFVDLHRTPRGQIRAAVLVPLCGAGSGRLVSAVLAVMIDPHTELYRILSWWPTTGRTAETLLVRREGDEVVFLNPLRFDQSAALRVRRPMSRREMPAVKAAMGAVGIVRGVDYRGVAVVADVRPVPETPWFLVSRKDASEAFSAARQMGWLLAGLALAAIAAIATAAGLVHRSVGAAHARTELEQERSLRMMADRQAAVLAAVPDIVMEVDNDKVYTWANDVGRDFFGEDVIGHRAADYFVGEQTTLETVAPLFDGASKETVYVESLQRRKDGEERLLAWWCRPLKDSAGHVIGAISSAHDITDERRAEEVRAATERRYRRILDGLLEGFQIIGRDWRYLYTNDAAARYGRRAKEDLLGKTVMECYPHFVATPAFAALERCMRERTPSLEDVAFVHDDGTESWLMLAVQPLPEGLAVLSLDVTDRKRRQMELDARNAEMERFLYAASHDLRSPLVTVMSFLSYLEDHIMAGAQTEIAEDLGYIKSAATTMDRLLAALLQLSRAGRVTGEPMDIGLEEVVSEARVAVAARLLDRGVELDFRGPNVKLHADRLKLVQLLQNLLENSTKFMGDQATPRIEVGAEGAGRDTVFYVRDNGLGMDPQYIERVFGLFERLDRRASGEGMGLAVVRRIAETYSGRAWAESDGVGHGVTIRFTLPDAVAATEREG